MDNRNDDIDALTYALAGIMRAFGSMAAEVSDSVARFVKVFTTWPGKVKPRHPRHKQIERARAMMERGQKGK
jgi:hypothetical protein